MTTNLRADRSDRAGLPWHSHFRKVMLDPLAWYLSKREIHALTKRESLESIVAATDEYLGRGFYGCIRAMQRRSEILTLAALVRERRPSVIVEIGTCRGGTLFIWCRSNPQADLFVSIDLPDGPFGGGYRSCRAKLYREFLHDRPRARMALMRASSHDPATLEELKRHLAGRPIDFLYIDGDHSLAGVRADFSMYLPLVRKDGIVALHDIRTEGGGHEVQEFWTEAKRSYRHEEIVASDARSMGIGVVFKD